MKKEYKLGSDAIGKLLLAFSVPCIISMLINSVYNIIDQIFIGQGVGYLGNGATNVIYPIVIVCTGIAQLIGNGCAASLSLRLGEGNQKEANRSFGAAVVLLVIASLTVAILGELFLPSLIQLFGCTEKVYPYALAYGRIILLGSPFMILYTGLSAMIRADDSPKYAMILLVIGAIINIVFDPIFIFVLRMGVEGGAIATVLGQAISCVMALIYLRKTKSVHLEKHDYRLNNSIMKTLGYGLSSFIIQMTVLALFIVMNNVMTHYGATSKFGADIPLSVYGIVSKLNGLYVSVILGLSCGAQPIIGFNYGAGNYERVKEMIKRVLLVGFFIGLFFNLLFVLLPKPLISLFGGSEDPLYMEFAVDCLRIFLSLCALNFFEMCSSILIQSLGNVKKSTAVSFLRQIILFIPLCFFFTSQIGLYGALYAGPVADFVCFIFVIFIFLSEYKKLGKQDDQVEKPAKQLPNVQGEIPLVITISREYGSGGRYIASLLAERLSLPLYDKEMIHLTAKESGFTESYIEENEQQRKKNLLLSFYYNNDDAIFIAESKVIKRLAKKPCIIVGRCADAILSEKKNVFRVFIYNDKEAKIKRAVTYYHLDKVTALDEIEKMNKNRAAHYKYYTNKEWKDFSSYDLCINSDALGIEKAVDLLEHTLKNR